MEDFGAHTNYCELALRELGYRDVFPYCGAATEMNIRGESLHHMLKEQSDVKRSRSSYLPARYR
jgi:hypothetical protein